MRLSRRAVWRAGLAWCLTFRIAAAADFPGFSIEPPTGDAWHLVQRNASSLVWMRRVPGAESTFGTAVLTQALAASFDGPDAFLAWVRQSKEENPQPDRFRDRPEAPVFTRPS